MGNTFYEEIIDDLKTISEENLSIPQILELQAGNDIQKLEALILEIENEVKSLKEKANPGLLAKNLSESQISRLRDLNDRLTDAEFQIKKEIQELKEYGEKIDSDTDAWVSEYKIECEICLCLRSEDPEYDEDDDNFLIRLTDRDISPFLCSNFGIADGADHNTVSGREYTHMKDEKHCYLYHSLYDKFSLSWEDMLRIGCIWIDITLKYRNRCKAFYSGKEWRGKIVGNNFYSIIIEPLKRIADEDLPAALMLNLRKLNDELCWKIKKIKRDIKDFKTIERNRLALSAEDLSESQISELRHLNERLTELEFPLKKEMKGLQEKAEQKVAASAEWINDYNLECQITYTLNNPAFDKLGDIIMCEDITIFWWDGEKQWGLADGENHNTYEGWERYPMKNEIHCSLYHSLYDHISLSWEDMLRIGSVWINIQLTYQHISVF